MLFVHSLRWFAMACAAVCLLACDQASNNADTCFGPPQIALYDGVFSVDATILWVDVCAIGPATLSMVRVADDGEHFMGEVTTQNPCISSVFAAHALLQPGSEYHVTVRAWPGHGDPPDVAFLRVVAADDAERVYGGSQW